MYKWKASPALRKQFIKFIFGHGYNDGSEYERQRFGWSPEEMEDQCDDLCLLSLFQRYVTFYPDKENIKMAMEHEFLASIAISEMLEN